MNKKVSPIMTRTLWCPKCNKKTLRASVEKVPAFGKEYYCDQCHIYVGSYEVYPKVTIDAPDEVVIATTWFDDGTTQVIDEPFFATFEERNLAYEEVNFAYEQEDWWDERDDRDGTSNDGIDFGATHV